MTVSYIGQLHPDQYLKQEVWPKITANWLINFWKLGSKKKNDKLWL